MYKTLSIKIVNIHCYVAFVVYTTIGHRPTRVFAKFVIRQSSALVQAIYEKYLANPPQIATEAIPTVLCSEQPPESQKKSLGKSKWWNIVKIIYN